MRRRGWAIGEKHRCEDRHARQHGARRRTEQPKARLGQQEGEDADGLMIVDVRHMTEPQVPGACEIEHKSQVISLERITGGDRRAQVAASTGSPAASTNANGKKKRLVTIIATRRMSPYLDVVTYIHFVLRSA